MIRDNRGMSSSKLDSASLSIEINTEMNFTQIQRTELKRVETFDKVD